MERNSVAIDKILRSYGCFWFIDLTAYSVGAHGDNLERVVLTVAAMNKDLDWALLSSPLRRKHLKPVQKRWRDLALLNLTVCSFMISVAEQAPEAYSPQFTMLPVRFSHLALPKAI